MTVRTTVTSIVTFDAAHHLPFHVGVCAQLHGHTYKLEVTVGGEVNPHGMVIDFADVKNSVRRLILDRLDHTLLNNEIENPTAERVAHYIFDQLSGGNLPVTRIRLWETPTCYVDVEP